MSEKEMLQKNVEEFSRLQRYMKLSEKRFSGICGDERKIH